MAGYPDYARGLVARGLPIRRAPRSFWRITNE